MPYPNEKSAREAARLVLAQMKGPGWEILTHENLGWFWKLRNGFMSLSGGYNGEPRYFILITDDKDKFAGCGADYWRTSDNFTDPNEAVYNAVIKVKEHVEKVNTVYNYLTDYLDVELSKERSKVEQKQTGIVLKVRKKKEFIGGKRITRKEALKGLGDPSFWKAESDALYKEMKKKPCKWCNGSGDYPEGGTFSKRVKCDVCNGKGKI